MLLFTPSVQVIAEFPATFRGRDTIIRIYSHRFYLPPLFTTTSRLTAAAASRGGGVGFEA